MHLASSLHPIETRSQANPDPNAPLSPPWHLLVARLDWSDRTVWAFRRRLPALEPPSHWHGGISLSSSSGIDTHAHVLRDIAIHVLVVKWGRAVDGRTERSGVILRRLV